MQNMDEESFPNRIHLKNNLQHAPEILFRNSQNNVEYPKFDKLV